MMIILTISHYWTFARNYPNFIAVPVLLVGFFVFFGSIPDAGSCEGNLIGCLKNAAIIVSVFAGSVLYDAIRMISKTAASKE